MSERERWLNQLARRKHYRELGAALGCSARDAVERFQGAQSELTMLGVAVGWNPQPRFRCFVATYRTSWASLGPAATARLVEDPPAFAAQMLEFDAEAQRHFAAQALDGAAS